MTAEQIVRYRNHGSNAVFALHASVKYVLMGVAAVSVSDSQPIKSCGCSGVVYVCRKEK